MYVVKERETKQRRKGWKIPNATITKNNIKHYLMLYMLEYLNFFAHVSSSSSPRSSKKKSLKIITKISLCSFFRFLFVLRSFLLNEFSVSFPPTINRARWQMYTIIKMKNRRKKLLC